MSNQPTHLNIHVAIAYFTHGLRHASIGPAAFVVRFTAH